MHGMETTKLLVLFAGLVACLALQAGACGGGRSRPDAGAKDSATVGGTSGAAGQQASTGPAGDDGGIGGGSGGSAVGGSGGTGGYYHPREVAILSGPFRSVSAADFATCAVKTNGAIVCWGDDEDCCSPNGYGQGPIPAGSFTSVTVGWFHGCGVRTDGTLACWGENNYTAYGPNVPPAGVFSTAGSRSTAASPAGATMNSSNPPAAVSTSHPCVTERCPTVRKTGARGSDVKSSADHERRRHFGQRYGWIPRR
jgi:hypothetical protein